ncbi:MULTISPECIES: helix-turn-helix domain-containing protein [unclassified Nocardia]|uniref:AraC-like ligand-binding domain-containing protein n=1 Tax=unclassified Nocardia TaxID=2637762 RepID=UPI001CE4A2E7|nr:MULTISPECIES: helix-turn-helix domain-containing protein [unclassified Nocardia]
MGREIMRGIRLSTEDVEPAIRLDYWRRVMRDHLVEVDLRGPRGAEVCGRMVVGDLGAVRVVHMLNPPGESARTERLIRRADSDHLVVYVHQNGYCTIQQDDREVRLRPGDVVLVDLSRPYYLRRQDPTRFTLVRIPRSMLPLTPAAVARSTAVALPGTSGAGAIVGCLVGQLARSMDDPALAGDVRLSAAVVDVMAAALAERADISDAVAEPARRTALLLRIQAFIEQHLADPELSLAEIAAAHHISVRYLQKLFTEHDATVSGWIRARRLDRCRRDLLDPALYGESVAGIGSRWGFSQPAHFNRIFATHFGAPPGEYRRNTVLRNLAELSGHCLVHE